jgi:hypothetical protein
MAYVSFDVDLSEFDDEELIDELEQRGLYSPSYGNSDELIDKIYQLRRLGKNFVKELDQLIYIKTGRAI